MFSPYVMQEAKERADIEGQIKDASKKIAKDAAGGSRKKATGLVKVFEYLISCRTLCILLKFIFHLKFRCNV